MSTSTELTDFQWYAVQTLSNQEAKVKRYLDKFIEIDEMADFVKEVLMPTETVTEVKSGKKLTKARKLYPGYIFIHMRLYDDSNRVLQKPWYFVRGVQGIISFIGGEHPHPLKPSEIQRILDQISDAEGVEKPKVEYEIGEEVKITEGPFLNLNGRIDEVDPEKGKLKVSVSIFGRDTPVELEYWQVERAEES